MSDINTVVLSGNITRDPESKALPSGTFVTEFSLAVNKLAEAVAEYLTKGSAVIVSGRLDQQRWETNEGAKRSRIKVIADRMKFPPKGSSDDSPFGDD
jgi:single-strand DNA-binding protein